MKIGEVSEQTGLSAHTIRYYEKLGLIAKPEKDDSGHRRYGRQGVELLNWIACLKKSGMPLSKIQSYVDSFNADDTAVIVNILEEHLVKLRSQQLDIVHYIDVTSNKIKRLKSED